MSSLMSLHGMALATAMVVSGTVILMALCRQKPPPTVNHMTAVGNSPPAPCSLRSCISSEERKRERAAQGKVHRRVRFAEDLVVELEMQGASSADEQPEFIAKLNSAEEEMHRVRQMPANRIALYHGILQDRLQRMACSY